MKASVATTLAAFLFATSAFAQTLCSSGEIDYFSCQTSRNAKVISVCGNIVEGEIEDDSWVQYRFGKPGAIELAFPKNMHGAISMFEGNYFNKYGVIDFRFISGNVKYSVTLDDAYRGDDAQVRDTPSGVVSVEIGSSKPVNTYCSSVDIRKYFTSFSELNTALRNHNGNTDIFYGSKKKTASKAKRP